MPKTRFVALLLQLGADFVVWMLAPAAFLWLYIARFSISSSAALPHLRIVLVCLLGLTIIRLVLAPLYRTHRPVRIIVAITIATAWLALATYYTLALTGLQSWGRVISLELITGYAGQLPELADALGIPFWPGMMIVATVYVSVILLVNLYLAHIDWPTLIARSSRKSTVVIFSLCGAAICAIEFYNFVFFPPTAQFEPLSLTFFPLNQAKNMQGQAIDTVSASRLDRIEDLARLGYRASPDAERKNLILIVVDALRPDHMGVYGYERDTTPYLSGLAREGKVRIVNGVHATCAKSACGLLSLASSKYVHQFSNHPFTLQQVLKRHGYQVKLILSGDHTNFYGLKQLYGDVDDYFDGSMAHGRYINDDHLLLEKAKELTTWNETPTMMQFHLMSSHILGKRHDESMRYKPWANYIVLHNRNIDQDGHVDERVKNFYDNGVFQADTVIRQLLSTLEQKGYLQNALVVITADHGESLGEHGLFAHANSTQEEVLRIPLLLIAYGYTPQSVMPTRRYFSQTDIAPTILEEFNMSRPANWAGSPLQKETFSDFIFFQEGHDAGFIDNRNSRHGWKFWTNSKTGEEFVFDLEKDSKERLNLIATVSQQEKREWRRRRLEAQAAASEAFAQ
jgi:glucan phosphoethanolaminetransferase (alkaline phosphatase superfamily)